MGKVLHRANRFLLRLVKYWLNFDWWEAIGSYRSAAAFLRIQPSDKTVLMIEPNRYHAEILPGYCHYFQRLGFDIVLMIRRENERSGVFARFVGKDMPKSYAMHPKMMRYVLKKCNRTRFAFVFITSAYWIETFGHFGVFCNFLGGCPEGQFGYAMIVHDFEHILSNIMSNEVEVSRIAMLSPYQYQGMTVSMVNPHYFGPVVLGALTECRVFITVGAQYRSYGHLFGAARELEERGYRNFKIQVIGRSGATRKDFPNAPSCVEFLGRLDFSELYKRLEEADFFLPLLDSEIPSHRHYLEGQTTGARQLILGFLKVPVIQEQFANAYGFNEDNGVVYTADKLSEGMLRAMKLSAKEYEVRRTHLKDLSASIESESLQNLVKYFHTTKESI